MPTFPSSPLRCRTAGFPRCGSKAGLSDRAFPGPPRAVPGFHCTFLPDMPSPKTPGSSTSSVPDSDVDVGLRHDLTSSALPISLQSASRRVKNFEASTVHAFATACKFACPPCTDPTGFPAIGGFYFWASGRSVTLPASRYNYSSDWTPLLVRLSLTGMAASLAAPDRVFAQPRAGPADFDSGARSAAF
jgi:hypothetical protein